MKNIILSSGIGGIDWRGCLDNIADASTDIAHYLNVLSHSNGKFDDAIRVSDPLDSDLKNIKSLKTQFSRYLTRLEKGKKNVVNFISDPLFIESSEVWQRLNSSNKFVFFFCSPEYYLAKVEKDNVDQHLCFDNWLEDASKIWDFYVRYPESTLLINVEDVESDPTSSISKIFEVLGNELEKTNCNQSTKNLDITVINQAERLQLLIQQNIKLETIKGSSVLNELYENLALTSILTNDALTYHVNERAMSRLSECQDISAAIGIKQVQLESESASRGDANTVLMADNDKLNASLSQYEAQYAKLTAENKLTLLRINQIQDELDTTFLKSTKLSALNKQLEKRTAEVEADNATLSTRNSQLEISATELTAENELALLQISQLQEELEANFLKSAELSSLNVQLKKRIAKFEADNTRLATENSHNQASLTNLTAENELALLQINQLQEELEHYFVEYQKMTYSPNRNKNYVGDLTKIKHSLSLINLN